MVVLVWCLIVELLSPGLSAFYATALMIVIVVTQRPLFAFFRGQAERGAPWRHGLLDLRDGLAIGARNMIGIAVATAAAGIIVGAVTLTGVGLKLTEFVEFISGGYLFLMLIFTAIISLILGMGLPTTANYIVVATLMAPVIVELGAQSGLLVPLIAVHMFVFYFGIMADVTPPVGLASFAAAAISGADPMQDRPGRVLLQPAHRRPAVPVHLQHPAAADRRRQLDRAGAAGDRRHRGDADLRRRDHELVPDQKPPLGERGAAPDRVRPVPAGLLLGPDLSAAARGRAGADLPDRRGGAGGRQHPLCTPRASTIEGDEVSKTVILPLGAAGTGEERLASAGLELRQEDGRMLIDLIRFGSAAERAGLDFDFEITSVLLVNDRPPPELIWLPALLLLGAIIWLQRRRRRRDRAGGRPRRRRRGLTAQPLGRNAHVPQRPGAGRSVGQALLAQGAAGRDRLVRGVRRQAERDHRGAGVRSADRRPVLPRGLRGRSCASRWPGS